MKPSSPLLLFVLCVSTMFAHAEEFPGIWYHSDSLVSLPKEDSVSWTDEYTVISVVRDLCPDSSQCLWSFTEDDSLTLAVLTNGIYTPSAGVLLSSRPRDFSRWCIYAYHSGIRGDSTKQRTLRLGKQMIDRQDTATMDILHADIEMEEFAYFKGNVPRLSAESFRTYLALRYGITLDYAPYLSPVGDTLWHPVIDEEYYHHVKGIGYDTLHSWYSLVSQSKEDAVLYLCADTLEAGEYVIVGDDDGDVIWRPDLYGDYSLQRRWQIRQHTKHSKRLVVALRLLPLSDTADSLWLHLTDGNGTVRHILPADSVKGDSIAYFTLCMQDSVLYMQLHATAPKIQRQRNSKQYVGGEDKAEETIVYDAQTGIVHVKGFPEGQMFELYLYDSTGKLCSTQISQNHIDVSSLPQMVLHIGIIVSGKTIGSISLSSIMY